ncbi:hypothetical protein [Ancylobacter radicis]|uniref:Uncharacterized protein n=1 Tax=Ancylobacter radicis TaxID=2836179 RepID=A0ABS5R8B5_9HYPH|nr:hypothetical protein [Ancylobacter radicis]MBS9476607.1 hypothetical protein [Ancylobacter radicis]
MNELPRDICPRRDTAHYIAEMAHELAVLAAVRELAVLRYLLEMARDEARAIASQAMTDAAVMDQEPGG